MIHQKMKIFKLRNQISTGGQKFVGNGFCDDGLNKAECNFDAGDCCNSSANTDHCTICQCLSGQNGTTTSPGNTGLSFSSFFTGTIYNSHILDSAMLFIPTAAFQL